jgi:uncharacterized protein
MTVQILIHKTMGKYLIKKSSNGQFFWVLNASNGQTLIKSETYVTKDGCKAGIASSKVSVYESNFRKLSSVNGQYYFNQVANNYQVLGTSETYTTSYARDNGVEVVKREAPSAIVDDLT